MWAIFGPVIASLVFGVPSIILYVMELIILLARPSDFDTPFYRLCIARSIPTVISYVCGFQAKFGYMGIGYEVVSLLPPYMLRLLICLNYYSLHAENLSTLFILANRCTAVLLPFRYDVLWRRILTLVLVVIFTLPLVAILPNFTRNFGLFMRNGTHHYNIDYNKSEGRFWRNSEMFSIAGGVFCALSVAMNVGTLACFKMRIGCASERNVPRKSCAVELRLTVYGFVTFSAQFLIVVIHILIFYNSSSLFYVHLCWINDLCTMAIPAWLLLWASSKVRRKVLQRIGIRNASKNCSTTVYSVNRAS